MPSTYSSSLARCSALSQKRASSLSAERSTLRAALPEIDQFVLQQMPFSAFVRTIADLLGTLGYRHVTVIKPTYDHSKGRNTHGGLDIRAYLPASVTRGLVIVQLKQYKRPVPRAFVDELRGAMVRLEASQGLLITTATFSAAAQVAAQAGQSAAPVRLIDGRELVALLKAQSGIKPVVAFSPRKAPQKGRALPPTPRLFSTPDRKAGTREPASAEKPPTTPPAADRCAAPVPDYVCHKLHG